MSKKNIISQEMVDGKLHVTFDASDGQRTYAYSARVAKQIKRGKDPVGFSGKLVEHKKAQ